MLNQLAQSDLRALKVFKVVTEAGSFTAAQDHLNVSESTISSQISGFEERIGFQLCSRGRSGFQLTTRGQIVLDEYLKLETSLDSFRQTVNSLENMAVGSLRVGTLEQTLTETEFSMSALFDQFINHAPLVKLHLSQDIQSALYQDILDERLDIALGAFNVKHSLIRSEPLYTERQYIYCGAKHPLTRVPADAISLDDITEASWVLRGYYHAGFAHLPINDQKMTATAANLEAITVIILAGHHIGYLPEHYAATFEEQGKLCRLLPEQGVSLNFSMISKANKHETMAMKVFREIALGLVR